MTTFFSLANNIHWTTPPGIITRAKEALGGGIDLDPCAGVKTDFGLFNFRLPTNNGLTTNWLVRGIGTKVFINPPFGTSYVKGKNCISSDEYKSLQDSEILGWTKQTALEWAKKVVKEANVGCNIVWLSKASTETTALQYIMNHCSAICHPLGRVNYINAETSQVKIGVTFPSIIIYLGPDIQQFTTAFADFGVILNHRDYSKGKS